MPMRGAQNKLKRVEKKMTSNRYTHAALVALLGLGSTNAGDDGGRERDVVSNKQRTNQYQKHL